jgi:hypothetical protein
LAEDARDYVTNIIFDYDMVSRLSPATMVNALLEITEFDWTGGAKRDIRLLFEHLQHVSPDVVASRIVSDENIDASMEAIDRLMEKFIKPTIKTASNDRMEKQLFVPGTCIHFYRDGDTISGATCPNTFFGELDFSRSMLEDHFLRGGYGELFKYVAQELDGRKNRR